MDEPEFPPIDFTTLVLSMSTNCMAHLGEAPHGQVNLPMAQQMIDILDLLERKTAGNLTGEEERILSQVLVDLREAFGSHAA